MCRIAFAVKTTKLPETFYEGILATVFAHLELSNGGHGNGIAFPNRKGKIKIIKGVNYTPIQAAHDAAGAPWVLFHTRLASSGGISDKMCHPFKLGSWGAMVHNGMVVGKGGPTESDTAVMARVISEIGPHLEEIHKYLERIRPGVVAIALRGRRPKVWLFAGRPFYKSMIGPLAIWASEQLSTDAECLSGGTYELPSGIKIRGFEHYVPITKRLVWPF